MEFPCPPYPILANISGENLLKRPPHASACLPSKQMAITAINPFIVVVLKQKGVNLIKTLMRRMEIARRGRVKFYSETLQFIGVFSVYVRCVYNVLFLLLSSCGNDIFVL